MSGGSADDRWRCRETKATPSAKESTESIKDGTGVCRSEPWIVRSAILAFGKEVSGQPLQSDASFISIGEETWSFEYHSVLSRAQIETQATNIHTNSSAAVMTMGSLGFWDGFRPKRGGCARMECSCWILWCRVDSSPSPSSRVHCLLVDLTTGSGTHPWLYSGIPSGLNTARRG